MPAISQPPPSRAAPGRAAARRPGRAPAGFVLRFLAAALVGLAALAWIPAITRFAIAATVSHAAWLGRRFGMPLEPRDPLLVWGDLTLEIVPECTPLTPLALVAAAMLAYPAAFRQRALGIAGAAAALWIYNLARVLALVVVVAVRPAWFEFVHVYLWQAVTLAASAGVFLLWLRALRSRGGAR